MLSPVKPWRFSNISRLQHNRHICVNSLHAHKTCHKIPSTPAPLPRQTHSTIKFMFVRNQPADISKRRKEKQEPRHLPTYKPATMPNTLYCSPKKLHLFSYQTSKAVNVTCRLYTGSQQHRLSETGFWPSAFLPLQLPWLRNSLGGFALVPGIWFNQSVSNSKYQLLKLVLALFMSQQAISVAIIITMPQFLPKITVEMN